MRYPSYLNLYTPAI